MCSSDLEVDVVVLLEASPRFAGMIADLKEDFPHQLVHLEDSPFGIAVLSRLPVEQGVITQQGGGFAHAELKLKLPGRAEPLALYAIHPPPPINAELATARDEKLAHIAGKVAAQASVTPIVAGDFNVTPWSPAYARFVQASGLAALREPWRFNQIGRAHV